MTGVRDMMSKRTFACSTCTLCMLLLFLLSIFGVHSKSDVEGTVKGASELEEAISFLSSIGATGLCHSSSNEFAPTLPLCQDLGGKFDYAAVAAATPIQKNEFLLVKNGMFAFVCVLIAALAAGLTMGLMSIDPLLLHIKIRAASSETEKKYARTLLPIVEQHHLLLVSLLLMNSIAMEALPLFLDNLVPSYIAVVLSVTLVLFFGEIIPSALFTGPNQFKLAFQFSPLVKTVMFLLYPIAKPIALLLDVVLHHEDDESGNYNRGELSALVRIQHEERIAAKQHRKRAKAARGTTSSSTNANGSNNDVSVSNKLPVRTCTGTTNQPIHVDEVTMMEGALAMLTKTAIDVFTPLNQVFAVPYDMILNEHNIVKIYSSGHSRIPVFEPTNVNDITMVKGVLLSKQLMVINSSDQRSISSLPLYTPSCVSPQDNLVDLINMFQLGAKGRRGGHMAFVCNHPNLAQAALGEGKVVPRAAGLLGIVTLEDVLEELLQEEIYDEMDKQERETRRITLWAAQKWKQFSMKKKQQRESLLQQESSVQGGFQTVAQQYVLKSAANDDSMIMEIGNNGIPFTETSRLLPTSSTKQHE